MAETRQSCVGDCKLRELTATKKKWPRGPPRRGQQVGAAGMPNFCPYPANNAALVTELDPNSRARSTLAPPLLEPTLYNPLLTSVCSLSDGNCVCSQTAVCVSRSSYLSKVTLL